MTRPRIGSLCSGYGGLDMAAEGVLGGEIAWVADNDPGAAVILACRFPSVKNLGDITAVDWAGVEPVDILAAGFPCQPVSAAGRRKGVSDERWLFDDICAAIGRMVTRPGLLVLENVAGLLSANGGDAMAHVVQGLAALGYVGRYRLLRASDAGAPHRRERWFCAAWPAADTSDGRQPEFSGSANGSERGQAWPNRCWVGERPGPGTGSGDSAGRDPQGTAEDPYRPVGGERRFTAPGQAQGGRPRPDTRRPGGTPAPADTPSERPCLPERRISGQAPGGLPRHDRRDYCDNTHWGTYAPAIRRWETILGRPAPRPTEPGRTGERLSPVFVEWMMGLPEGWVTAVPGLTRNAQLKALGNGVVPAQAAMALRMLLPAVAAVGRGAA